MALLNNFVPYSHTESDKSPRRRVVKPPAADYIKSDLFQKNFQKIADLVRPGEIEPTSLLHLEEPAIDKEVRPRYVLNLYNSVDLKTIIYHISAKTSTNGLKGTFVAYF